MVGKGVFEIEPGKRGFKFGTYAASVTQKITGKKITEILAKMFEIQVNKNEAGDDVVTLNESPNTISYLLSYFYGGACSYADFKGLPTPTQSEIGDWLDELGYEKAIEIYNESLESPNVDSPARTPGVNTELKTSLK